MNCPVCKTTDLFLSDRHGVEIDYCPECRGVWLDREELEKIIEQSISYTEKPNQENGASFISYDQKKFKKSNKERSFLEDIFDI
jgi:Zn-finger nucleic acid-binding protein